jgi:branched-chain amino acid transport system substrate-binding protein
MLKKILTGIVFVSVFLLMAVGAVQAADTVKVGVISVLSGPLAVIGNGEKWSAEMAIEDYGTVLGKKIELISRDHAYNPGIANERAKELYQKEKVDVIIACPNSAAALAVAEQARIHKKPFISTSAGTTDLIGKHCNKYVIKWNYNDYMLATTVGLWGAENLGKKWYTITADYAWGHNLLEHFTAALKQKGGEHVGNDMVALNTSDFSPYILNAMRADPDVLVLLNVGKDAVNSAKAALEYGLKDKAKIVHALLFEPDIKGGGSEVFADNYVAASWHWKVDNPGARDYADRYLERHGERPHFMAAAVYSATWQYLEAVKRAGTTDPDKVIAALEGHTFSDMFANPGYIRPEDHMQVGEALLLRAKRPEEVKEQEDFFEIVGTLPADEAFGKPGQFGCNLQ